MIGRQFERKALQRAVNSGEAEFIAIYGRRRVGKTYLIREFFKEDLAFEVTGIHDASTQEQLTNVALALAKALGTSLALATPASWLEAFHQLETLLESLPPRAGRRRVIFLDELPWLDTHRSGFVSALGHFWNTWASRQPDVMLVVCGSAASWMIKKLLHNRGGLHNRVTRRLRLEPFTLAECEQFFQSRGIALNRKQIIEVVMITGGVPHYLKEIENGMSSAQSIDHLCFSKTGLLGDEFDRLLPSLFDRVENHLLIVRALAKQRRGLTRKEVVSQTHLPSGGSLTRVLEELEESGFIEASLSFGKASKDRHYRLIDEYSLFYLRWIEPNKRKAIHWENLQDSPAWRAWSGYAFESICRRHLLQMKAALGIAAVHTEQSTWTYVPRDVEQRSAQIDLLIDRRDACIHLCEMKFAQGEFCIDKQVASELRHKRETFRRVSKTKKSLFLTFITTHGVTPNAYKGELVQAELTMDALFAEHA